MDDDTILLVEVLPGSVFWTEPGDYTWSGERPVPSDESLKIGSPSGGFHVAFKDGTVWRLAAETPFAELSRFFTVRGARENDRDGILGAWQR